jgi:hypothetical protein
VTRQWNHEMPQPESGQDSRRCPPGSANKHAVSDAPARRRSIGACLRIHAAAGQVCVQILRRVGLDLHPPVAARAHVHARNQVREERDHLDCGEAQHDCQLLLEGRDDLEGFEELDNAQWLQRAQQQQVRLLGCTSFLADLS